MRKVVQGPVNRNVLHDELISAGLPVAVVEAVKEDGVAFEISDELESDVDAVVQAHDPTKEQRRRMALSEVMNGPDTENLVAALEAMTETERLRVLARGWVWSDEI